MVAVQTICFLPKESAIIVYFLKIKKDNNFSVGYENPLARKLLDYLYIMIFSFV